MRQSIYAQEQSDRLERIERNQEAANLQNLHNYATRNNQQTSRDSTSQFRQSPISAETIICGLFAFALLLKILTEKHHGLHQDKLQN